MNLFMVLGLVLKQELKSGMQIYYLKVANVGIGTTTGVVFFEGEEIIGRDSGASYPVQIYNPLDTYDKYSENDEFETLGDNLLDFTETNPFGTF